jgi:hypothetical protein
MIVLARSLAHDARPIPLYTPEISMTVRRENKDWGGGVKRIEGAACSQFDIPELRDLLTSCLLGSLFDPKDGDDTFLRNVD